ncbi:MAG TPA: hypothetical protein V6C71_19550 [Coleofasciculaceae cyanobacterium]|jgi:hypothetical protein
MGRKAKLKKSRQQTKDTAKSVQKYNQTEFVEQFKKMGYQIEISSQLQPKNNRGNIAPEIPQDRIEPQL